MRVAEHRWDEPRPAPDVHIDYRVNVAEHVFLFGQARVENAEVALCLESLAVGRRDATLILIAFRHGLRAIEICDLEWSQVEFGRSAALHVRRVKNGKPSVHPLRGDEIRALRELRRQFPDSGFVFATERGGPFTADAVNRLIKRIGERARMPFQIHAHMLRHGCGYALANAGHDTRAIQDWLGHRSIQHTVRYTELSPTRFKDFWRD